MSSWTCAHERPDDGLKPLAHRSHARALIGVPEHQLEVASLHARQGDASQARCITTRARPPSKPRTTSRPLSAGWLRRGEHQLNGFLGVGSHTVSGGGPITPRHQLRYFKVLTE